MKMRLLVGSCVDSPEFHKKVWFDSQKPQKSYKELGGNWWSQQIYVQPRLLRVGAIITNDLWRYEVLETQDFVFEVKKSYQQNRGLPGHHDFPVKIVSIVSFKPEKIYSIQWPLRTSATWELSQDNLMRFLTEPVILADVLK